MDSTPRSAILLSLNLSLSYPIIKCEIVLIPIFNMILV